MKNRLLIVLIFLFASFPLAAQVKVAGNPWMIKVFVSDSFTNENLIEGTVVELLSADSVQIMAAAPVKDIFGGPNAYRTVLKPPSKTGTYIVRVTHPGYETMTRKIALDLNDKQESVSEFFKMKRQSKSQKLGEVTVRATKIKFYTKGDTLVYNADAFNLAEGSMLDALIEQLPGAELKRDGRIFVRGRQVESLLLNGKDFFKGKNSIMLENLPAYVVKELKVYEKQSEFSELTGVKDDDPAFVMDVRLKREYSIGWTVNAQAGGGTEERWMGRLFAMRFTPQSRIMAFANANNTNETRKPGSNDVWQPNDIGTGQVITKAGGFDYLVSDKNYKYEISGNVDASRSDLKTESRQVVENFMQGSANTFSRRWSAGKNENTSVSTSHNFMWRIIDLEEKINKLQINIRPQFSYSHYDRLENNLSGEFRLDPADYVGLRDSMGAAEIGTELAKYLVNRVRREQLSHGHSLSGGGSVSLMTSSTISFNASVMASQQANESHDTYDVDYTSDMASDNRRRYYDRPSDNLTASASIGYFWGITPDYVWALSPRLSYDYSHSSQTNFLYRLDDLSGTPLGTLPSTREALLSTLDPVNSYWQRMDSHTLTFSLSGRHDVEVLDSVTFQRDRKIRFSWDPRLILKHEQMTFEGQKQGLRPQRTVLIPYVSFGFTRITPGARHNIDVEASFTQSLPSLSYQLPLRFDDDPLNVQEWYADLRRTNTYSVRFNYSAGQWLVARRQMLSANAQFVAYQNSVATGYTYNSLTGERTYRPENVNGNWVASANLSFYTPLDKNKYLGLGFYPGNTFNHSVDLVGLDNAERTSRSVVCTNTLHVPVSLSYTRSKWRVEAKVDAWWNHATSSRPGFETIDGADIGYGLSGKVQLPWSMEFSSDLTYIGRYGYSDLQMNTNDLVWNAQLSKSMLKGSLTFTLVGFDILGQLSQINYTLNAQGRTETWRNVIPSYGMLRVAYRFSKQPKKR